MSGTLDACFKRFTRNASSVPLKLKKFFFKFLKHIFKLIFRLLEGLIIALIIQEYFIENSNLYVIQSFEIIQTTIVIFD